MNNINTNIEEEILKVIGSGKTNSEILSKGYEDNIRQTLQNLVKKGRIVSKLIVINQWREETIYKLAK